MHQTRSRAAVLSVCTTLLSIGLGAERLPAQRAAPDTAGLRRALAAALGDEFEIVRDEFGVTSRERAGTFWLVHARPRRSGDYTLRYRYRYRDLANPERPLYTHVEHQSYVRVGERGCWRRGESRDVCLGDTIILPFVVDPHAGHTFTLDRREPSTPGRPLPPREAASAPVDPSIPHAASRHLRVVSTRRSEMLHRNGGSTIVHTAELEAVSPGRFNVLLNADPGGSDAGSVPVVVVARGEPVTVLLANETVVGRDELTGFSSHGGNQYLTTMLLLQPGDRISLPYSPRFAAPARLGAATAADAPAVTLFPFRLDLDERFNAWMADHLPAAAPRETR